MKKIMFVTTITAAALTAVLSAVYFVMPGGSVLALAITSGTVFYHFAMRLAVGYIINGIFRNKMNPERAWFRVSAFEQTVYKKLGIRKWKKHIPTYLPETFDTKVQSTRDIIMATCQAEIVHEIIALLSFVPIAFSTWFDELSVFIITSVIAAVIDSIFVILQRYNRPRLIKLSERRCK